MKKILLWTALLLALPAHAEWVLVASNEQAGISFFIDAGTIKKKGSTRLVWGKAERERKDKFGDLSSRSLREFDCGQERTRLLQLTSFTGPGLSGESQTMTLESDPWNFVAPETVGRAELEFVCAYDPKVR